MRLCGTAHRVSMLAHSNRMLTAKPLFGKHFLAPAETLN